MIQGDKRTAYRARMSERGMVQANEWVPRDQREIVRDFAQALRKRTARAPRNPAERTFVSVVFDIFTASASDEQLEAVLVALIACTDEDQRAVLCAEALGQCGWSLGTDQAEEDAA